MDKGRQVNEITREGLQFLLESAESSVRFYQMRVDEAQRLLKLHQEHLVAERERVIAFRKDLGDAK